MLLPRARDQHRDRHPLPQPGLRRRRGRQGGAADTGRREGADKGVANAAAGPALHDAADGVRASCALPRRHLAAGEGVLGERVF